MDTQLTVREQFGILDPKQVTATIQANIGPGGINLFDLDIVHVPNSGTAFEFPVLGGTDMVRDFSGIIVAWRELRRYYASVYQPGVKEPPTCSSMDMINGVGEPGGACATCALNEWGTGKAPGGGQGRGKACAQYRYLFVTCKDRSLPIVLAVPPSSLGAVRKYMMQLTSYNRPYYSVITKFSLAKGEPVPTIGFNVAQPIGEEELRSLAAYFEEMRHTFAGVDLTTADTRQAD